MYENNFWYLFDVKKLTSLNYDNLKNYYVNLEAFLKLLMVLIYFSNLKVLKEILPKTKKKKKHKKQPQIYLILSRN